MATKAAAHPGPHGIDLSAPGGIEALLAFHRTTFGDAVMEAAAGAPASAAPAAGAPPATPATPAAPGAPPALPAPAALGAPAAPASPPAGGDSLPNDPVALKTMIADLRRENASDRTAAKTKAADEARTTLAQEIGKALGLVKGTEPPDPAALAAQVAEATTEARSAKIDLAVYQRAAALQGDPVALLDSRAFQEKVAALDHKVGDFHAKIDAAIKAAIVANPKLKATQAAARSSIPNAGGTGEGTTRKPMPMADAVAAAYGTA